MMTDCNANEIEPIEDGFHGGKPGEPFKPCNGIEGWVFTRAWCERCQRDGVMNGTATIDEAEADPSIYCEILNRSFRDEALPEWVFDDDGEPHCTQFQPLEPKYEGSQS